MSGPVRAAVVGCGDVSVVHLDAVRRLPGATLVAVCDSDPGVARAVGEREGVPAWTDHRRMLAEARPDVVHVCTPHDQHADVAVDALAAGVHVVLEKPLAHSLSEGGRVATAACAPGAPKLALCLQNRYNPPVRALRDLVASGAVGDVLGVTATVMWHRTPEYYAARPWRGDLARSGGGTMMNQAIHTLDLLLWIAGPATTVRGSATRSALPGVDVEDSAHLVIDHESGSRSVMFATTAAAADFPVTLEVATEKAVCVLRGDLTVSHADGRVETFVDEGLPGDASSGRSYWGVSHARLVEDFYRRLPDPEPFWIGPRDGLALLEVLLPVTSAAHPAP